MSANDGSVFDRYHGADTAVCDDPGPVAVQRVPSTTIAYTYIPNAHVRFTACGCGYEPTDTEVCRVSKNVASIT